MMNPQDGAMVVETAMDILDNDGEKVGDPVGVYNLIRSKLRRVDNFARSEFVNVLFPKIVEQWQRPLLKAGRELRAKEGRLRGAMHKEVYYMDPTGPDNTRELLGLASEIDGADGRVFVDALKKAMAMLSPELKAEVLECWPKELEGIE